MAYRFEYPLMRVGWRLNFWRKASERLWAGSVEMIRTLFLRSGRGGREGRLEGAGVLGESRGVGHVIQDKRAS